MGALRALWVVFLLVNIAALEVSATTFSTKNLAPDTDGGRRFEAELGDAWTVQMLQDVKAFIVGALSLSPEKPVDHITFIVEDIDNSTPAYNSGGDIHVDVDHLASIPGDLKFEITGLMLHEVCHSFQNNKGDYSGDDHFHGAIEGIATYMTLAAGYRVEAKAKGGNWYDGYSTTAHFLDWIDQTQISEFVNRLNQRMGLLDWNDDFFVHITGKDVDTLWGLYQASL